MSEQSQRALRLEAIVAEATRRVKQLWEYADQHREATLAELERRAEQLSRGLMAGAVELVVARKSAGVIADTCPECGARTHYKGRQKRRQETLAGAVTYERGYYYCRHCRRGHYPLDEQLQIPAGEFGPGVQEEVSRLAVEMPFERAAETFTALKGISISAREVGRTAEARGAALGQQQNLQDELLLNGAPPRAEESPGEGTRGVALDAAMVHLRDGWHEAKVGVLFRTHTQPTAQGQQVRAVKQHYLTHIGSMDRLGEKLYAAAVRQGYRAERETIVCLGDGAVTNWEQFAQHFEPRVEVLDWYHATEHLWAAGNGLYGEKSAQAKTWVEAREAELWAGNVAAVLTALQEAAKGAHGNAAQGQIHYFSRNQGRMHYDQYRAKEYPVGSGVVESACKQLVTSRLCGAGMWWSPQGAQAILNLRAALLSHEWQQAWALTQLPPRNLPKS